MINLPSGKNLIKSLPCLRNVSGFSSPLPEVHKDPIPFSGLSFFCSSMNPEPCLVTTFINSCMLSPGPAFLPADLNASFSAKSVLFLPSIPSSLPQFPHPTDTFPQFLRHFFTYHQDLTSISFFYEAFWVTPGFFDISVDYETYLLVLGFVLVVD